jgi:ParB-like chromosome segregation protein Spo0J
MELTNLENEILGKVHNQIRALQYSSLDNKVYLINEVKKMLHAVSPFNTEPVDCVLWVKNETVHANDYNPNSVAPPEMELLRHSISQDGYTQPIVSMIDGENSREVIDGFHRNRVGKECEDIQSRVHGYLPVVTIRETQEGMNDRVASTIRHNRARGKHKVESMSDIVADLKKRNWSDKKISKELGMEQDEVLRLAQISGLVELFENKEFSKAWDVEAEDVNEENID